MINHTKIYGDAESRVGVRQLTEKIYCISHCLGECAVEINGGFVADFARVNPILDPDSSDIIYNSFLFMDDKTLLVDTLSPGQRDTMITALDELLGERKLDYLFLSHAELPHAGNTEAIRRAYPELELITIGDNDHYEFHGLENALLLNVGDKIELGHHTLEMIKPLFVDHALTLWFYEHSEGFLFPVDWALNVHRADQCFRFMDEMEAVGYSAERFMHEISMTSLVVFPWIRWADPDEIAALIDNLFTTYDIRIFAASHTNIIRKDMPKYAAAIRDGMRMAIGREYNLVY